MGVPNRARQEAEGWRTGALVIFNIFVIKLIMFLIRHIIHDTALGRAFLFVKPIAFDSTRYDKHKAF